MNECPNERLSGYLDGELPSAEAAAVEAHVAECQACTDELAALRELRELAAGLAAPPVSEAQWAAAWDGIAARVAARPRSRLWRMARAALIPAAAAAVVALAVGFWAFGPYNEAEADDACIVEFVESGEGYSSSYYHSDEAGVTIITLVPVESEEASSGDAGGDPH